MQQSASNYFKELQKVAKRYPEPKQVNQLILGAPKGMKFKTVGYLRGKHVRQCPWKFEEIPQMQFIGRSRGYYQFLSCGRVNHVILCQEVG